MPSVIGIVDCTRNACAYTGIINYYLCMPSVIGIVDCTRNACAYTGIINYYLCMNVLDSTYCEI